MSEPGVTEDAARAAAAAADRVGVEIRELHGHELLATATRLLDAVWGREPGMGHLMPTEALVAMSHAGCQVSGALRDGRLVGATAAFLGRDATGAALLHSHVTGVASELAGRGLGWALKQHQRAWALERGITTVRWTFDPLVRRNAVFNLVKLGARPVAYVEDIYGPVADARNAGLPTDRFVIAWELTERRVVAAAGGRFAEPRIDALRRGGARELLTVGPDGGPRRGDAGSPRLLAQVPEDIEATRGADPGLARAWAEALRDTVGRAVQAGHRVTGVTRDGWYALTATSATEELA